MAHEQSITIQKEDGTWVNISSVVNGAAAPRIAEGLFKQGKRKALGGKSFKTVKEAVGAARKRSKSFKK